MSGMLNLRDILELVDDTFDHSPSAQESLVNHAHQPVLHIAAQLGDQHQVMVSQQLFEQGLRQIAAIPEQFAKQSLDEDGYGNPVVDIAWGEVNAQQFAAIIDDQVQFEAVEPAHGGLAPVCQTSEYLVLLDTPVVTNRQRG